MRTPRRIHRDRPERHHGIRMPRARAAHQPRAASKRVNSAAPSSSAVAMPLWVVNQTAAVAMRKTKAIPKRMRRPLESMLQAKRGMREYVIAGGYFLFHYTTKARS